MVHFTIDVNILEHFWSDSFVVHFTIDVNILEHFWSASFVVHTFFFTENLRTVENRRTVEP